MHTRTIVGTGTAAVIAAAGTALIPLVSSAQAAVPSAPAATVHSYAFTSIPQKQQNYTQFTGDGISTDVNAKGKVVGYDTNDFSASAKTKVVISWETVDVPGGQLLLSFTSKFDSGVAKGTVTGGTGAYLGAKGSAIASIVGASGAEAVTIKFTL